MSYIDSYASTRASSNESLFSMSTADDPWYYFSLDLTREITEDSISFTLPRSRSEPVLTGDNAAIRLLPPETERTLSLHMNTPVFNSDLTFSDSLSESALGTWAQDILSELRTSDRTDVEFNIRNARSNGESSSGPGSEA